MAAGLRRLWASCNERSRVKCLDDASAVAPIVPKRTLWRSRCSRRKNGGGGQTFDALASDRIIREGQVRKEREIPDRCESTNSGMGDFIIVQAEPSQARDVFRCSQHLHADGTQAVFVEKQLPDR